jgi:hypothetical protein
MELPQKLLAVFEIDNAKPGLRPVRQIEEGEKGKCSCLKGQEKAKGKVLVVRNVGTNTAGTPRIANTARA